MVNNSELKYTLSVFLLFLKHHRKYLNILKTAGLDGLPPWTLEVAAEVTLELLVACLCELRMSPQSPGKGMCCVSIYMAGKKEPANVGSASAPRMILEQVSVKCCVSAEKLT